MYYLYKGLCADYYLQTPNSRAFTPVIYYFTLLELIENQLFVILVSISV
jgi:hypothetical protein